MTRGQLKTRVSRILGMGIGASDDTAADTALLEELANEGVVDILTRTKVHVRKASVTFDVGITEFDLDPVILRVWGIKRGTVDMEEQPVTRLDSSGYAYEGYSRLVLGLAGTGETAEIWYTPRPSAMTDDAHDPASLTYGHIPSEFHLAIVNYMLWHAADRQGDQQAGRGEKYRAIYEGQDGLAGPGTSLGRIKTAINTRGGSVQTRRHPAVLAGDRDTSFWQG